MHAEISTANVGAQSLHVTYVVVFTAPHVPSILPQPPLPDISEFLPSVELTVHADARAALTPSARVPKQAASAPQHWNQTRELRENEVSGPGRGATIINPIRSHCICVPHEARLA